MTRSKIGRKASGSVVRDIYGTYYGEGFACTFQLLRLVAGSCRRRMKRSEERLG